MDIFGPNEHERLAAEINRVTQDIRAARRQEDALKKRKRRNKHHGFSKYVHDVALLLYDVSGYRTTTAVQYLKSLSKTTTMLSGIENQDDTLDALVLEWWRAATPELLGDLASEYALGRSSKAKKARMQKEYEELRQWIARANFDRGVAPSKRDLAFHLNEEIRGRRWTVDDFGVHIDWWAKPAQQCKSLCRRLITKLGLKLTGVSEE